MTFRDCLLQQTSLHPAFAPQDAIKLCYQAALGAEHLLTDAKAARAMFQAEFDRVPARAGKLWEAISPNYARVNMAVWKYRDLPAEALFQLFVRTAAQPATGDEQALQACFDTVRICAAGDLLPFTESAWQAALAGYHSAGGGPVRHSEAYRQKEHPAYRVVRVDLLSLELLTD